MANLKRIIHTNRNEVDCPVFDPEEVRYEHWRKEINIWRQVTRIRKKNQGAIFLSMRGKAKDHVYNMDSDTLASAKGFEVIIQLLDISTTYGISTGNPMSRLHNIQGIGMQNSRHIRMWLGLFPQKQQQ